MTPNTTEDTQGVDELVDRLFRNGFGDEADRLLLVREAKSGNAKVTNADDLGGWSKAAVKAMLTVACSDLVTENQRLREALTPFASAASGYEDVMGHHTYLDDDAVIEFIGTRITVGHLRAARQALAGSTEGREVNDERL